MYEEFLSLHDYSPPEELDAEVAAAFEDGQKALAESLHGKGGAFAAGHGALARVLAEQTPGTFLTEAERMCDFQCDACQVPAGERCVES